MGSPVFYNCEQFDLQTACAMDDALYYCDYVVVAPFDRDNPRCADHEAEVTVTREAFKKCWSALSNVGAYAAFIVDENAPEGGRDTAEYKAWLASFCEDADYLRELCDDWRARRRPCDD